MKNQINQSSVHVTIISVPNGLTVAQWPDCGLIWAFPVDPNPTFESRQLVGEDMDAAYQYCYMC